MSYSDLELLNYLKKYKDQFGRVPSSSDIQKEKGYPSAGTFVYRFGSFKKALEKADLTRSQFKNNKYTDNELKDFFREIYEYYKRVPTISEFKEYRENNNTPSRDILILRFSSLKNLCEIVNLEYTLKPSEQATRVKRKPQSNIIRYSKVELKEFVFRFIEEFEKVPNCKELSDFLGFQVIYHFKKLFKNYNSGLISFGLKPSKGKHTEEYLEERFHSFVVENKRLPKQIDFVNSNYPAYWCYIDRFGSWTAAIRYYGYLPNEFRTIEELENDILLLCKSKKDTNILLLEDIDNDPKCMSSQTYEVRFLKDKGITLREFVNSIGFRMPDFIGTTFYFEDGEKVLSKLEYQTSLFFRENNIYYKRDIKYRDFVDGYNGLANCDYVCELNGKPIYIEIAGMLYSENERNLDVRAQQYKKRLKEKIELLEKTKVQYKIIYNKEFRYNTLENVFSFLLDNTNTDIA